MLKLAFTSDANDWTYQTMSVKGGTSISVGQIVFAEGGNESNPTSFFTLSGLKSDVTPDKLKAGILYYRNTALINDSSILDQNKEVSISSGYTLQLSNDVSPQETWQPDTNVKTKYAFISSDDNTGYHVKDSKIIYTATPTNTFVLTGLKENLSVENIKLAVGVNNQKVLIGADVLDKKTVTISSTQGYTLELRDGVTQSKEVETATWTQDETDKTKYTYTGTGSTAGYKIENGSMVYKEDTRATFEISNLKATPTDETISITKETDDSLKITFKSLDVLNKKLQLFQLK